MKNMFRFSALLCAMAILATSCTKDETLEPQRKPAAIGDEIIFGSRAGFENANADSRTIYSNETYTIDGVTFERIDWLKDGSDRVQIYCAEANGTTLADYQVTANSKTDDTQIGGVDVLDEGYLVKTTENALQWGAGSDDKGTHTFYAMYPATSQFDLTNVTLAQGIKMDKTSLMGIVPSNQSPLLNTDGSPAIDSTSTQGYTIVKPNMDYAYMAAKATATPADKSVSLDFVPIVTAVEIEVQAGAPVLIKGFVLADSLNMGLAGGFKADLSTWERDPEKDEYSLYPKCENLTSYEYTFTYENEDGGISQRTETLAAENAIYYSLGKQVLLTEGEKLKFTVFLRPGAEYKNLTLGFSPTEAAYLKSKLGYLGNSGKAITIPKHMKTKFTLVQLPAKKEDLKWDASNWMESIPDDRPIAYLSLPGTGGSFSYGYGDDPTNEPDANMYAQQTLDIDKQWEAGIRAFEVVVDRVAEKWVSDGWFSGHYEVSTLGADDVYVKCNKKPMDFTFAAAMDKMEEMVTNNSGECAVVILTYQPEGASPNRNCAYFAQSLKLWWDSIGNDQNKYTKYTPTSTLRDTNPVQGKVLVFVRMNQQDEPDNGDFATAKTTLSGCPFVIIDGCGTAKDRWGARGYTINDELVLHTSNSISDDDEVWRIESYMHKYEEDTAFIGDNSQHLNGYGNYIFTTTNGKHTTSHTYTASDNTVYTVKRPAIGSSALNFGFETETDGVTCWYQDWARVVKEPKTITYDSTTSEGNGESGTIYWFESYYEKLSNIEQTFMKAINTDPTKDKTIFINSLSGYYVVDYATYEYSGKPSINRLYGGAGGDIKGMASDVNPWFTSMVNDAQLEQTTGPTGVVMMDYVTSDMAVIGTIISNNFKYSK